MLLKKHDQNVYEYELTNWGLGNFPGVRVTISETPLCSCSYFRKFYEGKPRRHICRHIVHVLMKEFGIHEEDVLLAQVAFTASKLGRLSEKFAKE